MLPLTGPVASAGIECVFKNDQIGSGSIDDDIVHEFESRDSAVSERAHLECSRGWAFTGWRSEQIFRLAECAAFIDKHTEIDIRSIGERVHAVNCRV